MSYSLSPEAARELEEIVSWYAEHASSRVAAVFLDEFERAAKLVGQHPGLGTKTANGSRIFSIRRYPYCLFYRATEESVRIAAIAHERRGPAYRRQAIRR